jgi:excisionase family DNA binding protein
MEKMLSIEDVADILGLEYKSVSRLVKSGQIPAARIGRVYRISKQDLDQYIELQKGVVRREAESADNPASTELRCSYCNERILSKLGIAGRCEVCDGALCANCFVVKKKNHCKIHSKNNNVSQEN